MKIPYSILRRNIYVTFKIHKSENQLKYVTIPTKYDKAILKKERGQINQKQ